MRRPYLKFPAYALSAILSLYVAFTLMEMFSALTWDWTAVRNPLWGTRCLFLAGGCMLAGAARAGMFHPRFVPKYSNWLMATPWRPGVPLPLGPVALVWEDLILVIPLGVLAIVDAEISPLVPVGCYLLGHAAVAVSSIRDDQRAWFGGILAFIFSWIALCHASTPMIVSMLFASTVLAHVALSRSLKGFPWDLGDSMRDFKRRPRAGLAWPLDRLGPAQPMKPISSVVGWMIAALAGWWVFVLLTISHAGDNSALAAFCSQTIWVFCLAGAAYRFVRYIAGYWSPISLQGRIATGQFIIPGYDQILVAPLLMIAFALLLPRLLLGHLPLSCVGALTVAAVVATGLNMGPTSRRWQLTGHHRIFAGTVREPAVPKGRTARH